MPLPTTHIFASTGEQHPIIIVLGGQPDQGGSLDVVVLDDFEPRHEWPIAVGALGVGGGGACGEGAAPEVLCSEDDPGLVGRNTWGGMFIRYRIDGMIVICGHVE